MTCSSSGGIKLINFVHFSEYTLSENVGDLVTVLYRLFMMMEREEERPPVGSLSPPAANQYFSLVNLLSWLERSMTSSVGGAAVPKNFEFFVPIDDRNEIIDILVIDRSLSFLFKTKKKIASHYHPWISQCHWNWDVFTDF